MGHENICCKTKGAEERLIKSKWWWNENKTRGILLNLFFFIVISSKLWRVLQQRQTFSLQINDPPNLFSLSRKVISWLMSTKQKKNVTKPEEDFVISSQISSFSFASKKRIPNILKALNNTLKTSQLVELHLFTQLIILVQYLTSLEVLK